MRSVRFRKPYACLEHYFKDYDATVRTGFWKCRVRDLGVTTWSRGTEDWWIELEMRLAHLPSFMQNMGCPVILDLELPEIRELTKPNRRPSFNRWEIWTGPARPGYKITLYDDYRE